MNKFLYVASAVALLCSCSNEIVQEEKSDLARTIQFDTYVAGQTRNIADAATQETLVNNGFQVYAWNNETAIDDQLGLYFTDTYMQENGSIVAVDDHEWPGAVSLNFLGTYPSIRSSDISQNQEKAETDGFNNGSIPQTSVHVNTEVSAGTKDIMCALAENKSASDGVVNLSFSHILVKVQANIYYDAYYINDGKGPALENITLTGITAGDYDVKNQKWSVAADATSDPITYSLFNTTESDYFGSSESQPVYDYNTIKTDQPIRASLMLIPAKYTLTVKHNRGDAITSEVDLSDQALDGGGVSSLAGKVVTLNIHISDNHILFAQPTVEPWETGEVIPVD